MEDVLEVYKRPYDARRPVVCLDEASKQLIADVTPPLPMSPGQKEKIDYEYERCGTANIFMQVEPLAGKRFVDVTDQRRAVDFAPFSRLALRGFRSRTGAAARRKARDPSHAQARQLAEYGRDRAQCAWSTMLKPAASRQSYRRSGSSTLGIKSQHECGADQLAVRRRSRKKQAPTALSNL